MKKWEESFVRYFEEGAKKKPEDQLGVEVEHFIVRSADGQAVPYFGKGGVKEILTGLMRLRLDAQVLPDDDFFGFRTPDYTVTLEPAAQLEISIAPMASTSRIGEIYRNFQAGLREVLAPFDARAVNAGCQPVSRICDLERIPKRRYDLMEEWFARSGTRGAEMMKGTASLQVSVDYRSEEDFRDKLQAAFYYAPFLKLLCDNASLFQGEPVRQRLLRTDIWRKTDPTRCGILPGVFSETYGFLDYARFIGNMPPIFLKDGKEIRPTGDATVAELFEDRQPGREEIEHLLSMAFPDVRLKKFLEIRFADSVPVPCILAYCAVIKGLLYSEKGIVYAKEQIRKLRITEEDVRRAEDCLMGSGWDGMVYGQPVRDGALKILELAAESLGDEETGYLDTFSEVIRRGGIQNAFPLPEMISMP